MKFRHKKDHTKIWEETGKFKVHNYPPSYQTFAYITRIYREFTDDLPMWKEVEGEPIYFYDLSPEHEIFATIMAQAEQGLRDVKIREDFLIPIKIK